MNGGMQSLTTGTISSVASTTEASNADTTGLAVTNQITLNLGEISGGITSLESKRKYCLCRFSDNELSRCF